MPAASGRGFEGGGGIFAKCDGGPSALHPPSVSKNFFDGLARKCLFSLIKLQTQTATSISNMLTILAHG